MNDSIRILVVDDDTDILFGTPPNDLSFLETRAAASAVRAPQNVIFNREDRVQKLMTEVNQLLGRQGQLIRYTRQDNS